MTAPIKQADINRDIALGAIRSAVHRLDEIKQEMLNAGTALKSGFITPQMALDWCEEYAPGCLGYIPSASGLTVKRLAVKDTDEFKSDVWRAGTPRGGLK